MENTGQKPVLVTITGGTASGKSYLFNYIRDVAKLPCLISTTTRAPRAGEKEGVDYFYINEADSLRLEDRGDFAELCIYNGVRYGVTKTEFHGKLNQGIAFLICEASGVTHYAQPAIDAGALHMKVYVHTDPALRLQRFRERVEADMVRTILNGDANGIMKEMKTALNRQHSMLTEEMKWGQMHNWDRTVFGDKTPEENLQIILDDVRKMQALDSEAVQDRARIHNQYQWQQYADQRNQTS
jgi:guanylate kinase